MDSPLRFPTQLLLSLPREGAAGTPAHQPPAAPSVLPEATAAVPLLSAQDLIDQLRDRFEKLCHGVADAVNGAPAGQVINASEEKVRDLLADFRQDAYQTAIQFRLEAAQAAFPPSEASGDGQALAEQGR